MHLHFRVRLNVISLFKCLLSGKLPLSCCAALRLGPFDPPVKCHLFCLTLLSAPGLRPNAPQPPYTHTHTPSGPATVTTLSSFSQASDVSMLEPPLAWVGCRSEILKRRVFWYKQLVVVVGGGTCKNSSCIFVTHD